MLKQKNNEISNNLKKVAIMTSGGDAPGMNMVLVSLLRFLYKYNYQATIIYEGIKGLLNDKIVDFDYKNFIDFTDCIYDSGTVIKSSRVKDFYQEQMQDIAIKNLKKHKIELLIVIGGDGSYHAADCLSKKGIKVITIPATIDNDVASSEYTIGFYSALNFVYEYTKAIRNTAKSFGSFCLIEVMGNQCSDLSYYATIASFADAIITKDNPWTINDFINNIKLTKQNNKNFGIFIVSEKYYGIKNELTYEKIVKEVEKATNIHMKFDAIGYAQRGARPNSSEMLLAYKFAKKCIEVINDNLFNIALGLKCDEVISYDLSEAIKMKKQNHINDIMEYNKFLLTSYKDK